MVNQDKYDPILGSLGVISSHYKESGFQSSIQSICSIKESFDIKLLFVGHFNAGKSSLLNGLIGRPGFLKEAQVPQTAIAAELLYGETECAFAYRNNGSREPLTERALESPNEYSHLEYILPAVGLKQVSDYTIVDTPGFDSGIEAHAKALANYIGIGSAYIVVIDQEKGGIDKTTLRFVEEISHYSRQIVLLINKCDKITPQTAEDIAASAENSLLSCGFPYKVYTISKWDPDVCDKLVSIISAFNAQLAFDRAMEQCIRTELITMESILRMIQQKLYLDTFDLDEEIRAYTRAGEEASRVFAQKRKEAARDLDSTTEHVIAEIRNRLTARADSVAEALLSENQSAVEAIIVETVRPIMLASMKDISIRQIDSVASALNFTGLAGEEDQEALSAVVCNLAKNLKDLIDQGALKAKSLDETELNHKKGIYRAITGAAAIFTDIIAPWMEVVIILLPDIITLLRVVFGESNSERIKRLFINNVLPQICNKLYPQVKQNIETSTQQILNEYQTMLDEKLAQMKASIAEAEARKREKKDSFEAYKKHLDEDLTLIRKLNQQMG